MAEADALEVWVTTLEAVADTTVWRVLRQGTAIALHEVGEF